jgi:diguanylate cyclase (GGDEF)-like protein
VARLKNTSRRARELRNLSPLTGLPGNFQIEEEIQRSIDQGIPFAVLYCDLDNFKPFNDHYGWLRGNEVIQATAMVLQEAVEEYAADQGFVGHIGGDDFVAVLPRSVALAVAARICERFDAQIAEFYDPRDRENGFIGVEDRQRNLQCFSMIAISVGVATTERRAFSYHGEAVEVATEMKRYAKQQRRSSFAVDRRATG